MPWNNTNRIVCEKPYFTSVPSTEELWKYGLRFIGVTKTATRKFPMAYLSNIEYQNWGDMSGLLTRPVDRTNPVLGAFLGRIGTGGTSFLLEAQWIKGVRTLIRDGGKRNLHQMQSRIWLS